MKFRRKSNADATSPDVSLDDAVADELDASEPTTALAGGPWDEFDQPEELLDLERIDLGSLVIAPVAGTELRLQVDEASGAIASVLLAGEEGAIELRAFAAPRDGDLWTEILPQLRADVAQRGGVTVDRQGPWGTELLCQVQVQMPDGQAAVQPSRIVGVNGDRWMLRATFLGQPAVDPDNALAWEDALRTVVVRRGKEAKPKGESLPLVLPPQARRTDV